MPPGSLFFASPDHEMGFSPYIHNVILTGKTQVISLGTEISAWLYDKPEITYLTLASLIQQIGRVARLFPGTAYLLTKELLDIDSLTNELKEIKIPKDLSCKFIDALLATPTESKKILEFLKQKGANMGSDQNFLRAALAMPKVFGMKPEEVFVGVQGVKANPCFPTYRNKPARVDAEL